MKNILLSIAVVLSFGCAVYSGDSVEERAKITYYDRNGDGKVDLEKHRHPGVADADWELRDDDYNGRYEKKIIYGIAVTRSVVDIPVPTDVKIDRKP